MNCKEAFSDIVAVWPFADGEISYKIPFNVRARNVSVSELGADSVSALTAGRIHYSVGEDYSDASTIEIEERKCSVKSTTKYTSAGRAFDVVLTLVISEKSTISAKTMDDMEAARHDFLLQCADGEYLFVRSAQMAYRCVTEEDFSEVYQQKITVTMENYNGIQRVVDE